MALPPLSLLRRCAGSLAGAGVAVAGLAASLALGGGSQPARAGGGGVSVTSYGHSALMIQGGGATVLINPFKAVACAAGLAEPRVRADVILASSRLLDEGAPVASGKFLVTPGSYRVAGLAIEGVAAPHDRFGGRRFGQSTLWRWTQGGLNIAHIGGTAAQLRPEDKVLLGRPDLLIIGVGGGAKVYDGAEAAAVVKDLQPRRVIPVQYVGGKTPADCDQGSLQPFLQALGGTPVQKPGRSVTLGSPLSEATQVLVLR